MKLRPLAQQQRLMLLQQRSYTASFSTIEALAINYENRLQLSLELIPASKDMYMSRSMFVCMNYDIKPVLTTIQNRDHNFLRP